MEPICVAIEFPVSTYYAAKNRKDAPSDRELRDEELVPLIREVWEGRGKRLYGARKVWKQLRRDGVAVARCTVERLMRAEGMMGAVGFGGGRAAKDLHSRHLSARLTRLAKDGEPRTGLAMAGVSASAPPRRSRSRSR